MSYSGEKSCPSRLAAGLLREQFGATVVILFGSLALRSFPSRSRACHR